MNYRHFLDRLMMVIIYLSVTAPESVFARMLTILVVMAYLFGPLMWDFWGGEKK